VGYCFRISLKPFIRNITESGGAGLDSTIFGGGSVSFLAVSFDLVLGRRRWLRTVDSAKRVKGMNNDF
jgi:hypothetical protein